jgi:hypothetical protein
MPEMMADAMGWMQHRMAAVFDKKNAADTK